jgi:hypothetical protein
MALKQQVKLTGQSFIETANGKINKGNEEFDVIFDIKVASISGNKDELLATVQFADDKLQMQKHYKFTASVSDGSQNFIAQAYDHLKTLPEFAGATDC